MSGLHTALQEITLVLFTTLVPSGAVAFILTGVPVLAGLVARRPPSAVPGAVPGHAREARRLEKALFVPILLVLVGLVASASHLGMPSNALYVLTKTGSSPLSTEVAAVVVFLGLASSYWLYSFALRPRRAVRAALLLLADLAAVASVASTALAYSVPTMITWSSPLLAAGLVASAFCAGPLVALSTLRAAAPALLSRRGRAGLCSLCAAGLAASALLMAVQGARLPGIGNYMTSTAQLAPGYWWMLAAHAALVAAGLGLCMSASRDGRRPAYSMRGAGEKTAAPSRALAASVLAALPCLAGAVLALAGVFVSRFAFYMQHLTVGLGT